MDDDFLGDYFQLSKLKNKIADRFGPYEKAKNY